MIPERSEAMMRSSFGKTRYRYASVPSPSFGPDRFGVYVHVPFCLTKCNFCPFYKEIYTERMKKLYLNAIIKEIRETEMSGKASWVYFGGGTPNTLNPSELGSILDAILTKADADSPGVELLPALASDEYLRKLKAEGFTKISIGVESFSPRVLGNTGRKLRGPEHTESLIKVARELGLFVNADMMIGLPNQDSHIFLQDIAKIVSLSPSQVTIYPFMVIRGMKGKPSMTSRHQFQLIERAGQILCNYGYERKAIWTFALSDDVYDSSRDELVEDYAGFGPAAFSTYDSWKVVNPELDVYLDNAIHDTWRGFVAEKSKSTDDWRRFARMIYDLRLEDSGQLPLGIRLYVSLLRALRYGEGGRLTPKGTMFAHRISKTVVESLPFPVQNPDCVLNHDEYVDNKQRARTSLEETPEAVQAVA